MRTKILAALLCSMALFAAPAWAQLEPFKDYTVSEALWNVTTVKVNSNMGDHYLEGLRSTWVASNEVAKKLGQIEDYTIFVSELQNSGDWNMLLVVKFKNTADLGPNRQRYDAFMEAWGNANRDMVQEKIKDYPNMREITGEYLVRELKMQPK